METVPLHILVVDDNQEILDIMRMLLERHGCRVSTKIRVGDFIDEIKQIQPDLILMDKNLGWADGVALCALLKTTDALKHIPVIMLSAYHKMKENCLFAGADAFIQKPFEMAELLQAVNACRPNPGPKISLQ